MVVGINEEWADRQGPPGGRVEPCGQCTTKRGCEFWRDCQIERG